MFYILHALIGDYLLFLYLQCPAVGKRRDAAVKGEIRKILSPAKFRRQDMALITG